MNEDEVRQSDAANPQRAGDRHADAQPPLSAFTAPPAGSQTASGATSTSTGPRVPETPVSAAGIGHPGYQPPAPREEERRRTLLAQAVIATLGRPGARLGLTWITILLVLAIFAPFLASSHPLAMKAADGAISSPLVQHLHWVDVTLVVMFFTACGLLFAARFRPAGVRVTAGVAFLVLMVAGALGATAGATLTSPPHNVIYEQYREAEAAGEIDWAIRTIIPYSANDRLNDQPGARLQPPSSDHWFGTTIFGEDMLSRMIHASRIALAIGFVATGIAAFIGITIGSIMGYFAGWSDLLLMRLIEIVEAIPQLILLLTITAFYGKNIWLMMITIGLIAWTSNARFIRAEFLKLRRQDFVQAGVATGLPLPNLMFRHMLPNGVAPVLVNVSFGVAGAILLESILSFLGLGLEAEVPSWGQLLNQARAGGTGFNWWIATFPGLAIFLTVFAYILIGEAMRDAIDPKLKKAGE